MRDVLFHLPDAVFLPAELLCLLLILLLDLLQLLLHLLAEIDQAVAFCLEFAFAHEQGKDQ